MTQEKRIARLETRAEAEETMARFARLASCGRGGDIPEALFSRRADASIEYGASGPYIGFPKLSTFFEKDVRPGRFSMLLLSNPAVSIGADGVPRGTWDALGIDLDAGELSSTAPDAQTLPLLTSAAPDGARYRAEWTVQRFLVDFVREDGALRIWHLQVLDYLRAPMDSDFVAFARARWATDGARLDALFTSNRPFAEGVLPENLPQGGSTFHWQYHPDALPPEQ